jgi:hypothetical protein
MDGAPSVLRIAIIATERSLTDRGRAGAAHLNPETVYPGPALRDLRLRRV